MLFPAIGVPEQALLYVWLIVTSLFPLAIIFAWRYDVSLDGITRTPPAGPGEDFDASLRSKDFALLVALGLVAAAITLQFGTRIEPGQVRLDESISAFSIAVLPFDDLSGNPDEQYFVSGMQSALIDGLSRVRNLRVTSKVSTMPFRQVGGSLLDIASQLSVARIVEGTVLRDGNRVSIALRMHDAEKDQQVWSARFEDELENIMLLQAKAAQEIANQVRVQLGPEEREQFAAARPINAEAYQAFLKGVFHIERFTPGDIRIAASHFQRAVEVDPDSALGHYGLGKLCIFRAQIEMLTPQQAREQCFPPVRKALELDPFLPEAHLGLASLSTWQLFDWEAARPHFERALELNPSFADAHIFYSHFLGIIGELDISTFHAKRALELDPLNPLIVGLYSMQLVMRDEYDEAIETAEQTLSMAPGYGFAYSTLMVAHDALGNHEEAIAARVYVMRRSSEKTDAADFLEATYRRDGYEAASLQLAEMQVEAFAAGTFPAMGISFSYEIGGDYESAVDWLEIAVDRFEPDAPYIGALIRRTGIREHPRYKTLLERMGLDYWADNP
jgi:TolB-like protein/Tfp pilus assembly protein PilF